MSVIEGIRPLAVTLAPSCLQDGDPERGRHPGAFFCSIESIFMVKTAILIDGGYFLRRLPTVRPDVNITDVNSVVDSIRLLIRNHLSKLNEIYKAPHYHSLLYRSFYYDAAPVEGRVHTPVGKISVNYAESPQADFRRKLFENLYRQPNLAVQLGEIHKSIQRTWTLKPKPQKSLLSGKITARDLTDQDFSLSLRQKGVDMRIGMDIAAITLKRQANIIILVSGDSDFVPAAKFARREGIQFILDPLWQNVAPDLSEHIDGLRSGFYKPADKSTISHNS